MIFFYVCHTCRLIGSYEDIAGQDYYLPDDIVYHPHPMVFSLKSKEQAERYLEECLKNEISLEKHN